MLSLISTFLSGLAAYAEMSLLRCMSNFQLEKLYKTRSSPYLKEYFNYFIALIFVFKCKIINIDILMLLPTCTWSPIFKPDIIPDFPFLKFTVAMDGKQAPPPDSAAVVVVVVVVVAVGVVVVTLLYVTLQVLPVLPEQNKYFPQNKGDDLFSPKEFFS